MITNEEYGRLTMQILDSGEVVYTLSVENNCPQNLDCMEFIVYGRNHYKKLIKKLRDARKNMKIIIKELGG